ncbi:hypothetical protein [Alistipes sp.]|uniref:hypothetical protein n=1 Tax=Alistipes sp. TaxID=1872444 RepID=UPI003AEFE9D9
MVKKDKNCPQEPGYYWAAVGTDNFNTIVKVSGEAPFLTVDGYSFQSGETVTDVREIRYFGSKIKEGDE